MPKHAKPRERRLTRQEFTGLLRGADEMRCWWMRPIIQFAIETGMRRGEMLNATWKDLSEDGVILRIPTSKNGEARRIPLSPNARSVLGGIDRSHELLFPVSANALNLAWERLKRSQGIHDLRFHDLRHEAISRLFERGLSLPEVALISGHKDPRMLLRYTHLKAEDVAAKLSN
jgi:integrase